MSHSMDPFDIGTWLSPSRKGELRTMVRNTLQENGCTPDYPELARYEYQLIFVYGTLKKNFLRNGLISTGQLCGSGFTDSDEFVMNNYDQSDNPFPVVFDYRGDSKGQIYGELYAVKSNTIPNLDFIESNGMAYKRRPVEVTVRITDPETKLKKDLRARAWMYIGVLDYWRSMIKNASLYQLDRFNPKGSAKKPYYIFTRDDAKPIGENSG